MEYINNVICILDHDLMIYYFIQQIESHVMIMMSKLNDDQLSITY